MAWLPARCTSTITPAAGAHSPAAASCAEFFAAACAQFFAAACASGITTCADTSSAACSDTYAACADPGDAYTGDAAHGATNGDVHANRGAAGDSHADGIATGDVYTHGSAGDRGSASIAYDDRSADPIARGDRSSGHRADARACSRANANSSGANAGRGYHAANACQRAVGDGNRGPGAGADGDGGSASGSNDGGDPANGDGGSSGADGDIYTDHRAGAANAHGDPNAARSDANANACPRARADGCPTADGSPATADGDTLAPDIGHGDAGARAAVADRSVAACGPKPHGDALASIRDAYPDPRATLGDTDADGGASSAGAGWNGGGAVPYPFRRSCGENSYGGCQAATIQTEGGDSSIDSVGDIDGAVKHRNLRQGSKAA